MIDSKNYPLSNMVTIGGTKKAKKISIGGDAPVSVQTMWKESIVPLSEPGSSQALHSVLDRIERMAMCGCDILRFAVPDQASAKALCRIAEDSVLPLVADIHFDYKLALSCLEGNVSKIRINPGNIGSIEKTKAVVDRCKEKGVAIRIGINAGSLPRDLAEKVQAGSVTRAEALAETAFRETSVFEKLDFSDYVVSMKASSVQETIAANEAFASKYRAPLHIGVTEAGPIIGGIVKSTLAFSHLLYEGIGSTIRVSLSDTPENEIIAAREILCETGKRSGGVKIVSCPRCGRNGFDVHGFVERWQNELYALDKDITVAVMGCVVNGPGEGKHADIGITGTGDSVMIFRHGEVVRTIRADQKGANQQEILNSLRESADKAFREELFKL